MKEIVESYFSKRSLVNHQLASYDDCIPPGDNSVSRMEKIVRSIRVGTDEEVEDEDVVKMIVNNGIVTHMQRQCDVICNNVVTQLGLYMYRRNVIVDFPNCDMSIVQYWKGLDTIGFIGKYDVTPYDLECGKIRSVDRPSHIQEVESKL